MRERTRELTRVLVRDTVIEFSIFLILNRCNALYSNTCNTILPSSDPVEKICNIAKNVNYHRRNKLNYNNSNV